MTTTQKTIMYESAEAASIQTVTGWVSAQMVVFVETMNTWPATKGQRT